jgi:hypothetical protein
MFRVLPLVFAIAVGLRAYAQVEVELKTVQDRFLPSEGIDLAVRVGNLTGSPLKLGSWPGWLSVAVERGDGSVVRKLGELPESGDFSLEQSTVGTLHYDLAPLFEIDRAGVYKVVATVTPTPGGRSYYSGPLTFEVINGTRLEERTFGFVKPDGETEQRKYILQQANYLKQVKLYLRVTDEAETHTYGVIALGGVVAFNRPEFLIDRQSRFHILHQYAASDYHYYTIDPNGKMVLRQSYRMNSRRPQLRVNDAGEVAVIGGMRRLDKLDVPAPTDAEWAAARAADAAADAAAMAAQAAAATNAPSKKKKK